jgi:hypothetical protein
MALYIFGAVREAEKQPFATVSKMDRVHRKTDDGGEPFALGLHLYVRHWISRS